jgi:probable HAF family extracellular repeat protein
MASRNRTRVPHLRMAVVTAAGIFTAVALASAVPASAAAREAPAASEAAASAGDDSATSHKNKNHVGIKGHGFVTDNDDFTTVDVPGVYTVVTGINDTGQVVGSHVDARATTHGFLPDEQGAFITIDVPGAAMTVASKINVQGQIVGAYDEDRDRAAFDLSHGFLLDNSVLTTIDVLGAVRTHPHGINNLGQIVGKYLDAAGRYHGFLLDNGVFTTIDLTDPLRVTVIYDINNQGQLAGGFDLGIHGYLRDRRGNFTTIDHPDAVAETTPEGVNKRSQIVGHYVDATGTTRGFLRDGDRFTTIDVPGAFATNPLKIKERGQIVGFSVDAGGLLHGFLWDEGVITTIDVPASTQTQAFARSITRAGSSAGISMSSRDVSSC